MKAVVQRYKEMKELVNKLEELREKDGVEAAYKSAVAALAMYMGMLGAVEAELEDAKSRNTREA